MTEPTLIAASASNLAPTLAVTLGDPCGLGPELVVRTLADTPQGYQERGERLLLIGPLSALVRALEGRPRFFEVLALDDSAPVDEQVAAQLAARGPGAYFIEPKGLSELDYPPGVPATAGGIAAGRSLELAVRLAKAGVIQGLVTCPLNKACLQEAGFGFPGHTEFLAEGLGVGQGNVTMHLCGPMPPEPLPGEKPQQVLRVSLVTTHPPLSEVPRLVTRERILRSLRHTADFVARLGLSGPIGVCGLNPHAGESGRIGREDEEIVGPAVREARDAGLNVDGPIPADTLFHFAAHGRYAAVVAMYHDQGLGPLKLLHFGEAVNVTLGLPIIRTSPDHGTGYDLVGTGKAKLTSFVAALDLARRLVGGDAG
ncbi:MAG: 4-hydroxythreonine-4-phosphate dehydrogenase PdxA [Humidesulfovibrio sp.]|nr:4-hydroxythreonine-4-phosphate dehydrogenase PdxA [Humidesulfovibrio sp.]